MKTAKQMIDDATDFGGKALTRDSLIELLHNYSSQRQNFSFGVESIAKEREDQINKHGWSLDKDQYYAKGELLQAAKFCLDQNKCDWPKQWDEFFKTKIKDKNRIEQLIVAGALIASEIDRLKNTL